MIEEKALYAEWERADSQQGNSSEGALFSSVPSTRALSHLGAGPSGRQIGKEEVDSKEIEVVYPEEPRIVEPERTQGEIGAKPVFKESHPREGILLKNPRSKVTNDELGKLRYFFKIPQSVEIRALEAHERIDWVIPGWVAF